VEKILDTSKGIGRAVVPLVFPDSWAIVDLKDLKGRNAKV